MPGKRTWMALGLCASTLLVLFAATGVAMADREPGALKGKFGVAEPAPGDRAVYSLALLIQMPALQGALEDGLQYAPEGYNDPNNYGMPGRGEAFFMDAHARMIVERAADRLLPAPDGGLVSASSIITTWSSEAFGADFGMGAWGAAWSEGSDRVEAEAWRVIHAVGGDVVAVTLPADRVGGDLPGRLTAQALGVDSAGLVTVFESALGPCGFHSDLQGQKVDLAKPVRVDGQCPPSAALFGTKPATDDHVMVLASGHDDVRGDRATVFADVHGAERLRLWFTPDVPYPVRMLTQVMDLEGQIKMHLLYELAQFQAGNGEPREAPAVPDALAPRQPWGPAEDGFTHPFPLSAAWQAALDEGGLADFLAGHPQAQADSARFVHWEDGNVREERWTFTATDGQAARAFDVALRTAPFGYGTVPKALLDALPPLGVNTTVVVASRDAAAAGRMPPSRMPSSEPGVSPLVDRWQAARTGSAPAQSWAYNLCDDCAGAWVAAGHAMSINGTLAYSFLGLRSDGAPAFLEESQGPYVVPGDEDPDAYGSAVVPSAGGSDWNDPRGFGLAFAGFGVWTFPEPETAATVSIAAALVGLVTYVLWPLLKGLPGVGAVGLFSRIGADEVLEHPLRSQIVALVEAEPGLHFQELARRLETGRGTLEHHLRKLVAANVVSAQASQGFTCYFPKGKVDRRLMAAAPVLKSDGARLVLQAVANQPGRAAQDVAATTGLTPSTVNYHLKRLSGVGLVETVRSGRFTLLTPTAIGQQAIATWSGT